MTKVRSLSEVAFDLHTLPSQRLRARAFELLEALQEQPELGLRLDTHIATGDLSDCRKLYFDERIDRSPRYRIVYRVLEPSSSEKYIEVVSIGRRVDESVYHTAVGRLGR